MAKLFTVNKPLTYTVAKRNPYVRQRAFTIILGQMVEVTVLPTYHLN